jgi:hypothetical protein
MAFKKGDKVIYKDLKGVGKHEGDIIEIKMGACAQ